MPQQQHQVRKRKRCSAGAGEDLADDDGNVVELVRNNHILFFGDVSESTFARLRAILLDLEYRPKPPKHLFLHLKSEGGCAYTGLSCYDVLRAFPAPITCIVEGQCFSAATLLALGADDRYMLRNSSMMIHSISCTVRGRLQDQMVDVANTQALLNRYIDIYVQHTHMTRSQVEKEIRMDSEMGLPVAKSRGFVRGAWPCPGWEVPCVVSTA